MKKIIIALGIALLSVGALRAQDSGALLDALVKKGVLTDQEAEEVRANLTKEYSETSAGKMSLASHITQMKIYGDARARWQYDRQKRDIAGNINQDQNRSRLRFRIYGDYAFTDKFTAGWGLETEAANDSGNSTLDDAFEKTGDINMSLLWLQWQPQDWLTMVAGKQKVGQKFVMGYTWDSDVNPEGGLVKFGDFKICDSNFYVNSTHGFYTYDDERENSFAGIGNEDSLLLINQVTLGYSPNKECKVELTPGFAYWTEGAPTVAGSTAGGNAVVLNPTQLQVFTVNGTFTHPLPGCLRTGKLYGDYGVNIAGDKRAQFYQPLAGSKQGDDQFFVAGYTIGENKKKGDWSVDLSYAYFEAFSWDPNIADSDFGDSRLNQHGYGIKAIYNFTDFLTGSLNWRQSWMIDDAQTPLNTLNGDATAPWATTEILQADLVWKF
jgi:hypothetical protein